jgi:hypothetical protein
MAVPGLGAPSATAPATAVIGARLSQALGSDDRGGSSLEGEGAGTPTVPLTCLIGHGSSDVGLAGSYLE